MDKKRELTNFVNDIMTKCDGAQLDIQDFSDDEREFVEALNKLSRYNCEAKTFATEIAEGNLEAEAPERDNAVSWPFRALRSSLLHLTWQSQRVAAGDYNQKVDFLGEFSEAFNDMIHQLSIRERALRRNTEYQTERLRKMEDIAYRDQATGVYNRRYCMELIDSLLKNHIPFALGFVDLNNLKEVNDNFGHEAGDIYIETVVKSIRKVLRTDDVVCRIGGDEIIAILYSCSQQKGIERMEEAQQNILSLGKEHGWEVSISYGVVEVHANQEYKTNELLKEADKKMYEFKTEYKKKHHLVFH